MRDTLQTLSAAWGPPGHEGGVRDAIAELLGPVAGNSLRTDALGNLLVGGAAGPVRLLVAAHMDETGLFVTDIDDNGLLRFAPAGPLTAEGLIGQAVTFAGGKRAVVGRDGGEHDTLELSQLYLDVGAATKDEAAALVPVGSFGALAPSWHDLGGRVAGKALYNRVGCAVVVETLRQLGSVPAGVVFVFAAQGKLDQRGAKVAAQALQPQYGLAVDTMPSGDIPKASTNGVRLGGGVVVKARDQSVIAHPRLREWLLQLAESNGVPHQLGVQEEGRSEGGPLHLAGAGAPTGLLSVPLRNQGTANETVDLADAEAAVALLTAAISASGSLA